MHIAAYMAALEVHGLDHMAKMALLVVCGRANQHTGAAVVSARRLGEDMEVHRHTAEAALGRLVQNGYLTVEKHLGKTSRWQIDLSNLAVAPVQKLWTTPVQPGCTTEDSWRSTKEASVPANGKVKGSKPAEEFTVDLPPNPWVFDEETGVAYRNGG